MTNTSRSLVTLILAVAFVSPVLGVEPPDSGRQTTGGEFFVAERSTVHPEDELVAMFVTKEYSNVMFCRGYETDAGPGGRLKPTWVRVVKTDEDGEEQEVFFGKIRGNVIKKHFDDEGNLIGGKANDRCKKTSVTLVPGDRVFFFFEFAGSLEDFDRGEMYKASVSIESTPLVSARTTVGDAHPRSPFGFVGNDFIVDLDGVCNAEDHHIAIYGRFFKRNAAGDKVWMTQGRPASINQSVAVFQRGDCNASKDILVKSAMAGYSTGVQAVITHAENLDDVIRRVNFEGERYKVCHGNPGCD